MMNFAKSGIMNVKVPQITPHKKRSHTASQDGRKFDKSQAPPLPPLAGDTLLEVMTHKSLRRKDVPADRFDDNERLIVLGKAAFKLVLSRYLFRKRPLMKAEDLLRQHQIFVESGMIKDWVQHYRLIHRCACAPEIVRTLDSLEEINAIFYAYVGGVFQTSGPEGVSAWVDRLLAQETLIQPETLKADPDTAPVPKRVKSETLSPPPNFFTSRPPPPTARPNPLAPAQPDAAFLPLFNQEASKRRVTVEYLSEFSGPSHAGRWTVKCIVNGICKGQGSSSHKQTAKEEAARNAFDSMGWR